MDIVKLKTGFIITVSVLVSLVFAYFLYFHVIPILVLGGLFDNPPDKNKVMQTIRSNEADFENAIDCIKSLDSSIIGVEYINGKICSYTTGTTIVTEEKNDSLEKIFKAGVRNISILKEGVNFFFGGAGRDYYTGLFYSFSGEPVNLVEVNLNGACFMKLTRKGDDGWEWNEENSDNRFYCEKIIGNWYYYQMWY